MRRRLDGAGCRTAFGSAEHCSDNVLYERGAGLICTSCALPVIKRLALAEQIMDNEAGWDRTADWAPQRPWSDVRAL